MLTACGGSRSSNSPSPSTSKEHHELTTAVNAFETGWTALDEATQASINPNATDKTDALAYEKYLQSLTSYSWPPRVAPAMSVLEDDVATLVTAFERSSISGDEYESPQLLTAEANEVSAEGGVEYTLGIISDESYSWEIEHRHGQAVTRP